MWQFSCTLQFSLCAEFSQTQDFSQVLQQLEVSVRDMAANSAKSALRDEEDEYAFLGAAPIVASRGANNQRRIEDLRRLWRRRILLCRVTAGGLLLSIVLAVLIPSRYTSTVQLMPPDQDAGGRGAMMAAIAAKTGGSMGGLGAELLGLKTNGELFIGILKSRVVADGLIRRFDLRNAYRTKLWKNTRKQLATQTIISQERKSGILTIEVSDRDPRRAQAMAEEYVSKLDQVVTTLNVSSASRERVFLEQRLKAVQADLDSAQIAFSQFASRNTTIDIEAQGKAMIESGAALAGQLATAETELEGLRQIYAKGNVRVRSMQARADELRRQLQRLGGRSVENQATKHDPTALYPPIRELPLLGVTYADLFRRVKAQEAVFETLTREYESAKVQEVKDTPSVKVLDAADLPERKSSPPRATIIIMGTIFSAAAGSMWVIGNARWREVAQEHPGKLLTGDILEAFRSRWPLVFRNGSAIHADESSARD
jgi:capsule polysaccharide export protein KpsE/RkpR